MYPKQHHHIVSPAAPAGLDISRLRALHPFTERTDAALARITAACELLDLPAGPWRGIPDTPHEAFLTDGTLVFTLPHAGQYLLSHDSPRAAFPLPLEGGYPIHARTACRLILVPQDLLEDGDGRQHVGSGVEVHEGDIEDQVYLDFYQALASGRCELPSMPDLAQRIAQVIDDPNTASQDIARVIQSDPALAARVMSVVNSAAYGAGQSINSLQQAVSRLGRRNIRDLVFSFIVKGIFRTDSKDLQQRMRHLWTHSCHVAAIATVLARYTPGLDPEHALLAGLIHDIGVVPVLNNARMYPELMASPALLDRVVADLRGEVGALTLRQWGFGDDFIQFALHAEDWTRLGTAIPDYLDILLIAQLHAQVGSPQMHKLPTIDSIPAFRKVADGQLTPRGSLAVLEKARAEIAAVQQMLANA